MATPHPHAMKTFTAVETREETNGQSITVYTLSRGNRFDTVWKMTRTSFKTFRDGFDAPKVSSEVWNMDTATDMIQRFQSCPNCRCDFERMF